MGIIIVSGRLDDIKVEAESLRVRFMPSYEKHHAKKDIDKEYEGYHLKRYEEARKIISIALRALAGSSALTHPSRFHTLPDPPKLTFPVCYRDELV
jgi:hypothetical protein